MSPDGLGVASIVARLGVAFLLALPLAWERQQGRGHHVGLRTVPLVSVGACGYLLLAQHVSADPEGRARVLQGLLSGIGFIGAGAILKHGDHPVGIATAATIWNMGAIGSAAGVGDYELASILSAINFGVLLVGKVLHKRDAVPRRHGDES